MRRRLITTYLTVLAIVLIGLSVPFALTLAANNSKTMFLDRMQDAALFASYAEPVLRDREQVAVLEQQLRTYDEIYGVAAVIVSADRKPIVASRKIVLDEKVLRIADYALSGNPSSYEGTRMPWDASEMVVAEPVTSSGEVIGVALTISPAAKLQRETWVSWILLAAAFVVTLVLGALATGPVARWAIRPVHELDEAAHALAEGKFLPEQVTRSGPPELRRLTQSFTTMASRVTALLARQRTFASYASHQLRTPLATLRLSVENLKPAVDQSGLDDFGLIASEIQRMAGMCDALLTYALAEVPTGVLIDIDVLRVCADRVSFWQGNAIRAGIALRLERNGPLWGQAAGNVLDQALDALLSNAIKFCRRGDEVTVTTGRPVNGWVTVQVADTGPGLSTEDLARAAEAFWRKPADQNKDGSGLGITIAQSLITASGGKLALTNAVPHGLRATISLKALP